MKTADYIKTLSLVTILLFFFLQNGSGAWLGFLLLFYLVIMLYNVTRMFRRQEERKRRSIKLAIWTITLALTCTVQNYWSKASHNEAELALKKIINYKGRTGTYPSSLKEVGLDDQKLIDTWRIRYVVEKGKATLIYPMPFMPMAMYEYDFETRKWRELVY
jgi:hypothetical protein